MEPWVTNATTVFKTVSLGHSDSPPATIRRHTGRHARVTALAIGVAIVLASWSLCCMQVARRLPPGVLRDVVGFLPDCATLMWRLRRDPAVPRRVRLAVLFAALWVASPIDLIPEFLPVIGPSMTRRRRRAGPALACRGHIPREVVLREWPGRPEVMERLLPATRYTWRRGVA